MTMTKLPISEMRESAARLPLTMSMPLSKAASAFEMENYKDTLTHLLDFFEMSVQWLNCYFLALACSLEDAGKTKGVARAVRMIDVKRPLSFGDCVNELFNPLLESLQQLVPEHPLVRTLSENVRTRRTDILVGSAKTTGIIKVRNDYKGHSTSLSQHIYCGVVEEIAPKVEAMLQGLAPLADASVATVSSSGEAVDLHGGWNSLACKEAQGRLAGHYYVGFPGIVEVDLFPLMVQRNDRYIYVFQTLKGEAVKYESSDENVHGFETEEYNRVFDAFMQRLSPTFDIAKEANWNELCACMRRHSMDYMIQVQKEKKYSADLFVDRIRLTELLDRFTKSHHTLLPLAGDAGQGKTNQICNWTERFIDSKAPVLVFGGASFADATLAGTLKSVFGISHRRPLKRLLDHLHAKAAEEGKNVYFFFDAVNECLHYKDEEDNNKIPDREDGPVRLFADIVDSLVRENYPRFKIVTTCRSFTWKNQILPLVELPSELVFGASDEDDAAVVGFTDRETEEAYRKYGELYQMSTPFERIERKVMLRLRDPLVMKFVCSNYVGAMLSDDADDYTTVRLFSKMLEDIEVRSFAGRRQRELLDELSRIFLLSYIEGRAMGSIVNTDLKDAYHDVKNPLHRLSRLIYRKDGLTVAYTELRNKPDRPILREVEKTVDGVAVRAIEFIYERFLEYMMARAFLSINACEDGRLSATHIVEALSKAAINVVFIGAMRNVLLVHILGTGDFSVIVDLITGYADNPAVMQLVNEVFDSLIRENYEDRLFSLLEYMLGMNPEDEEVVPEFNLLKREIASNKATSKTILRHKELAASLAPVIGLRNTVGVAVNNMLLSDFFNENLYRKNVLEFLWRLMTDDIVDVGNETCKFVYYLSRRRFTHSHTPLNANLTKRVVKEMYAGIRARTIVGNMARRETRKRAATFVEAATRLATLLIIDATVAPVQDTGMIAEMLGEIRGIASYFTWNYRLVHLVMPFLQTIMRKQITFQSVYVNNAIEYQGFWNDDIVKGDSDDGAEWSRRRLRDAMEFVGFYNRHNSSLSSPECEAEKGRFRKFLPVVVSAYSSGCSFSYFIMERILIIVGCADWNLVRDVFVALFSEDRRGFEWFDYMQMSLLYNLFQLEVNSKEHNPEVLDLLTRETRDWTLRCRGLFKARHSHKANPTGLYKRNVVNWYCVAYCAHSGDNVAHEGDGKAVPLLYELIDNAVADNDKELLFHLLDNISELISDFGYVATALGAVKYVMTKYESRESVAQLDACVCGRGRFSHDNLVGKVGSVLSTAKTYFPSETDVFLRSDIVGLKFPGVEGYREEILNYHPGGETLSDLFTHKFGNFLLWSLLHEKEVDDFAYEAVCAAIDAKDCFAWFDQVIRILCRRMFNVKI